MRRTAIILALLLAASTGFLSAEEILVASASSMTYAMRDIAVQFEKATGCHVNNSFAASGVIYSQVLNGAPFELFLSADTEYPRKLESAGFTEPGSFRVYSVGRLVLWTGKGASLHPEVDGVRVLADPSVRKVAIANPRFAPYGRAALAALRHFGLYEIVQPKIVYGENVSQAAQYAESGAAQVGIIPLSLAVSPSMRDGRYWKLPADSHSPIQQAAVVLKPARDHDKLRAVNSFLNWLGSPAGRAILEKYGFSVPSGSDEGLK